MNLEDLPTREGFSGRVCTGCNHLLQLHGEIGPARIYDPLDPCGCCDSFIPPPPPGPVFLLPDGEAWSHRRVCPRLCGYTCTGTLLPEVEQMMARHLDECRAQEENRRRRAPAEDVRPGQILGEVAFVLSLAALVLSLLGLILEGVFRL